MNNFAKSFSKLDSSYFNGQYSYEKEGVRVTGAVGSELAGSQRINNQYAELFRISGLYFDENIERGTTQNGETLSIDIISNDYDTVLSNYQDTDNDSSFDNAVIKSLDDLGFDSSNNSIEVDRSSEIYTELRPTNIYRTSIGHLSNISNLLAPKINRTPIEPPSEDNRSKIYKRSSEHLSKIDRPSFRR